MVALSTVSSNFGTKQCDRLAPRLADWWSGVTCTVRWHGRLAGSTCTTTTISDNNSLAAGSVAGIQRSAWYGMAEGGWYAAGTKVSTRTSDHSSPTAGWLLGTACLTLAAPTPRELTDA